MWEIPDEKVVSFMGAGQSKEFEMATLADALAAYSIFAQAEGKSPKTVLWIMSGVTYFSEFMGQDG